jgi:hypothetical protein
MKKIVALLSLTAFLAVAAHAQTSKSTAPLPKKETTEAKDDTKAKSASTHSCCMKSTAASSSACCKDMKDAKNCTPEQKAACAKAGKECEHHAKGCSHAQSEVDEQKAKEEKAKTE